MGNFHCITWQKKAKCNYCGSEIRCDSISRTSGLKRHRERCKFYKKAQENETNKILTRDGTTSEDNGKLGDEYRSRSSPQYDVRVTVKQVMEDNAFMDEVAEGNV